MSQRKPTKAEREWMDRVANLGCMLCHLLDRGHQPATLHHVREGQGMSQRASHWLVVPLCPDCHQGPEGLHGSQALLKIAKVDEMDLLAETLRLLYGRAA